MHLQWWPLGGATGSTARRRKEGCSFLRGPHPEMPNGKADLEHQSKIFGKPGAWNPGAETKNKHEGIFCFDFKGQYTLPVTYTDLYSKLFNLI